MTTLLLVGCGSMGFAMLKGWREGDPALRLLVVEPAEALRQRAVALGIEAVAEAGDLPRDSRPDLVVLAVKPQVILDVLPAYRGMAENGATMLSVAAGTTIAALAAGLPEGAPIIRCMPNTPASIGAGMMVCHANAAVPPAAQALVERLLAMSGAVAFIDDEADMDAVTAVSGSGPAYVFHFIECLAAAGEKAGLAPDLAARLALQTVMGAGQLAAASKDAPSELRRQVTSPGGTTAAALAVLMGGDGLAKLVEAAVDAAKARSIALRAPQ